MGRALFTNPATLSNDDADGVHDDDGGDGVGALCKDDDRGKEGHNTVCSTSILPIMMVDLLHDDHCGGDDEEGTVGK